MATQLSGSLRTLVILSLVCGCGTEPEVRPLEGTYAAAYDPGVVGYATETCDRLISHVVLSLTTQGTFDLSINVVDDCSRGGGGVSSFEVLEPGTYSRLGPTLSLTLEGETTAALTGQLIDEYMRLTLPADFEALAPNHLELRLDPVTPN